ncbi:cupredoxin domain-containing protein [Marinomonas sp. TI.3.20]|uniref:cupredoxin domain-containing protein n=1 Tax=Marinomonas sp. TI.3.20 TaxID=3121296 RepID=UPI00311F4F4D
MLLRCFLLVSVFSGVCLPAYAERLIIPLELTPNGFLPKQLHIPANTRIQIKLNNNTKKVAELESYDMKFEKIAVPNGHISVFTGPLKAGKYTFFNDYASNVAGTVIVKKP